MKKKGSQLVQSTLSSFGFERKIPNPVVSELEKKVNSLLVQVHLLKNEKEELKNIIKEKDVHNSKIEEIKVAPMSSSGHKKIKLRKSYSLSYKFQSISKYEESENRNFHEISQSLGIDHSMLIR